MSRSTQERPCRASRPARPIRRLAGGRVWHGSPYPAISARLSHSRPLAGSNMMPSRCSMARGYIARLRATGRAPGPQIIEMDGFPKALGLWRVIRGAASRREGRALVLSLLERSLISAAGITCWRRPRVVEIEDREETLRILPAASGGTAIADRGAPHAAYPPHHRHPPESRTRRATIGARADWR